MQLPTAFCLPPKKEKKKTTCCFLCEYLHSPTSFSASPTMASSHFCLLFLPLLLASILLLNHPVKCEGKRFLVLFCCCSCKLPYMGHILLCIYCFFSKYAFIVWLAYSEATEHTISPVPGIESVLWHHIWDWGWLESTLNNVLSFCITWITQFRRDLVVGDWSGFSYWFVCNANGWCL